MRKFIVVLSSVLIPGLALAQDTAATGKGFWDDPINHPMFLLYATTAFLFLVLLLMVMAAWVMLKVLNAFAEKAAMEKAQRLGVPYVQPQSLWSKLWQNANALRPLEEERELELDHNYDGIRELDNHLPPWWKGLFYGTIVFAAFYLFAYHLSNSLPLSRQEYQNELTQAAEKVRLLQAGQPVQVIDENTLTFTNNAEQIAHGKAIFKSSNCASCHRDDGGGNTIGPNLTDSYWLHGGDIKNIYHTINNGVVEKAMPAWGKVMSQKDVVDLAFFVMSLQGSNPANAKAPQGELFKPQPSVVKADSVKPASKK